jgi:hypothetical protein
VHRGSASRGKELLEKFLRITLQFNIDFRYNEIIFQNAVNWIIQFLGRLLIGGNIWKEFVVFIGEKDSGKTTFVRLLKEILGSYAVEGIPDSILYKDSIKMIQSVFIGSFTV